MYIICIVNCTILKYVSVQSYFKEEDVGKEANVAVSGSESVAMVDMKDENKKVNTDTERYIRQCRHMMSFPLSHVDLSRPRAIAKSQTLPNGSLERLSKIEMATLRCHTDSTYEIKSELTEASSFDQQKAGRGEKETFISSLTVQPTKTTQLFVFPENASMLDPEPQTVNVRNIDSTAGSYVSQYKETFKMSAEVKLEVKGQTKTEPLQTLQNNSTEFSISLNTKPVSGTTNVHPTDTADDASRTKSVKDSIAAPSGSPRNLTSVSMETGTGSTSVNKVKSLEKNEEIRATSRPMTPMQTQPAAITQQIPFHQPGSPSAERQEASSALRESEQEQIKHTDETPKTRQEDLRFRSEQKAPVIEESETEDCSTGDIAACLGRPTTATSTTTETHCKLKKISKFKKGIF